MAWHRASLGARVHAGVLLVVTARVMVPAALGSRAGVLAAGQQIGMVMVQEHLAEYTLLPVTRGLTANEIAGPRANVFRHVWPGRRRF